MEKWQYIEIDEDCRDCGNVLEVLTKAQVGSCYDGDSIRCIECSLEGWITVFEDGSTLVHYYDEL